MIEVRLGDCRAVLPTMAAESVDCVVTSPPYFGLRDYGVAGQIGLEDSPDAYVAELVAVFREVRRVLKDDGTLWLNLGDSYAQGGSGGASSKSTLKNDGRRVIGARHYEQRLNERAFTRNPPPGLKAKDLIGIPWRVAFALQADGWWLRSEIIWAKPNPMPESVTDRPTSAHEKVFLLSKSPRYWFDADAVREPMAEASAARYSYDFGGVKNVALKATDKRTAVVGKRDVTDGRNIRNVWTIATQPFPEAHFATFPPALVEPCIKAGCRPGGTVLDPFFGAGTVGLVADRLGRDCIGIELNPEYGAMARRRIREDAPLLTAIDESPRDLLEVARAS